LHNLVTCNLITLQFTTLKKPIQPDGQNGDVKLSRVAYALSGKK